MPRSKHPPKAPFASISSSTAPTSSTAERRSSVSLSTSEPPVSYARWLETQPPRSPPTSTTQPSPPELQSPPLTPSLLDSHTSSWRQLTNIMKEHWAQSHMKPYVFSASPYSVTDLVDLPPVGAEKASEIARAALEKLELQEKEGKGMDEDRKGEGRERKRKRKRLPDFPDPPLGSSIPGPVGSPPIPPLHSSNLLNAPIALTPTPKAAPKPAQEWHASSLGNPSVSNRPECPLCKKQHMSHKRICKGGPPCTRCEQRGRTKEECIWSNQRQKGVVVKRENGAGVGEDGGKMDDGGEGNENRGNEKSKAGKGKRKREITDTGDGNGDGGGEKEEERRRLIREKMVERKRGADGKFVVWKSEEEID